MIKGYEKLKTAALEVGLPIIAIGVDSGIKDKFDDTYDGVDIWTYNRMMPKALW